MCENATVVATVLVKRRFRFSGEQRSYMQRCSIQSYTVHECPHTKLTSVRVFYNLEGSLCDLLFEFPYIC